MFLCLMLYFLYMAGGSSRANVQTINISTKTLLTILAIGLGLFFLWYIRAIVAIFLAALLLAALIEPFAAGLARRKIPRGIAVSIVYVLLGAITVLLFVLFVPVIIEQVQQLFLNLSTNYDHLTIALGQFESVLAEYGFEENFKNFLATAGQSVDASISTVFSTVTGVFYALGALFAILVLAYFMVIEEEEARKYFKNFLPAKYQPFLAKLFKKMQKKIGGWMRGQIVLAFIVGGAVYIGLSILGVEYALLLAIIAGLFEILPYIGPVLSTIPAVIIAFADSPLKAVLVLLLYFLIQQVENNILVPKIMQKAVGLNPIVSILALLIGITLGQIDGAFGAIVGALLSIPLVTMIAVVAEDLFAEKNLTS